MNKKSDQSRRKFISNMALGAFATIGGTGLLTNCSGSGLVTQKANGNPPDLLNEAPDGRVLKAGLVGCGGRGTGAAVDFFDAGPNLEVVALGDVFQDQLDKCRKNLKRARDIDIPDENCFSGFDSYKGVIESGVDVVLLATPPHFRPLHVKAAVDAGKHIFQEKPIAVDPAGALSVLESSKRAQEKNLCIVSGTVFRYQKDYIETHRRVANGEIGEIVSTTMIRNGGALWYVDRKPEWTEMEYMIRNWGNFTWLSGDGLVEMMIHHIDQMNWHIGKNPVKAIGYGGRQRRSSGDQYDIFNVEYIYDNGVHATVAHRQVSGCDNGRVEKITGTKGYAMLPDSIYSHDGELKWKYPNPSENDIDQRWAVKNPYKQEQVNLVTAIRTGNYLNDSEAQVNSTLVAIMGRMSAYTGKDVTWEELINSDLRLGPETYAFGPVSGIIENPPVIGTNPAPTQRY